MRNATNFDEVEAGWRDFLHEINRVWTKTELACKVASTKFPPWQGRYAALRRKDPLLRYLLHARNSDEHTLTELTARHSGGIAINPAPGSTNLHIRSMRIRGGRIVHYDGTPAEVTVILPRLELLRVFDRGEWYNPPTQHLGQPLDDTRPEAVATLGLEFYRRLVDEAEANFFAPAT